MNKKMMVTGMYYDKETGAPRCMIAPISEGISKKNGKPYCILDTDRREVIEGEYQLGQIVNATTTYAVHDGTVKLNK